MEVFVSYSASDKPIADAVVARLERTQLRCWYAPRDINPGKPYGDAILDGLQACRTVVVIVSRRALASPHVLREVERAIHYGLTIVPFRVEQVEMRGAFELFLSVSHWLDAMTPPLEHHIDRLAEAIRSTLSTEPGRTAAPPPVSAAPPAAPAAPAVEEVSPDRWSRRPRGWFGRTMSALLEDTES